jgi:GTPase
MRFVDQAKIFVKSGPGGNGALSFRREAFVEFGGPDGGNGGRGGHVVLEASEGLNTLIDYRYQRHLKAKRGQDGMGKNRTGADGKDLVLRVPAGTQVFDDKGKMLLADLAEPGMRVILAEGGRGGVGNAHFKSSTNRAPRRTIPGGPGIEMWVVLRLKLLADVGLIGLPNAGKSTFLSRVSRAKPKIAAYPFTTLSPNLGYVEMGKRGFVMADIPGLIEGAHQGAGLGTRFLGHVERCRVLIHLVDGTAPDVKAAYKTVRAELKAYGAGLTRKTEIVALNKCDALGSEDIKAKRAALKKASKTDVFEISAVSGKGIKDMLEAAWKIIAKKGARAPRKRAAASAAWSPL